MPLTYAACTDVGRKRRVNEDAFAVRAERGVFVVADGLGGHVAGRRASDTATAAFVSSLSFADHKAPADAMRFAMLCANLSIHDVAEREPDLRGMATTLVSLWIRDGEATLAHVGDSRLYLMRAGELWPLTVDHSVVGELVARGDLPPEACQEHPQRHVITRALGVALDVEPDLGSLRVQGDDIFLLCSDGISSQIRDEEIRNIVHEHHDDLDSAARTLIRAANDHGGDDNATAVLVSVKSA